MDGEGVEWCKCYWLRSVSHKTQTLDRFIYLFIYWWVGGTKNVGSYLSLQTNGIFNRTSGFASGTHLLFWQGTSSTLTLHLEQNSTLDKEHGFVV